MNQITFGSVCSGIEAASVAWHPLGWRAAWLSEIEPFPCAVLAHHYPDVPNLGDMTKLPERIRSGEVVAPDVFCGGTPCQAFSVAGLRKSLDDARGNLSLIFCEIANEIDAARLVRGEQPATIFWENVPGVLSTKDNAFGCFLAGLAGEDDPLVPPGGRWTNAGTVHGPARTVAWRVLDAQYFGVAQRRRRVFVVASARDGFDPVKVLFEFDGVRRDTAPSRQARQGVAGGVEIGPGGGRFTDLSPTLDTRAKDGPIRNQLAVAVMAYGGNNTAGPIDVATARNACASASGRMDFESETFLVQPVSHSLRGEGFDVSEDGTGRGTPLVPVAMVNMQGSKGNAVAQADGPSFTLNAMHGHDVHAIAVPVAYSTKLHNTQSNQAGKFYENYTASLDANSPPPAIVFDTTQVTSPQNRSNPQPGDPCHPLAAGAHSPAIAFPANLSGTQCASAEDIAPSMGAKNPTAVAFQSSQSGVRVGDTHATLDANNGPRRHNGALVGMQVRRLTPVECERLQGFPDNYTAIPWKAYQVYAKRKGAMSGGKSFEEWLIETTGRGLREPTTQDCPDGPRYKALGNSWAVPNVRWIGCRIDAELRRLAAL